MPRSIGFVRITQARPDWLFVYKPAGLPVFPHPHRVGPCLLQELLRLRPEQGRVDWPAGFEGGIAHRLDNGTSGLLVVARSPSALQALRAEFAGKELLKTYLFLTAGQVSWSGHRLAIPLAHDRRHRGRMVVQRGRSTPHRGRWFPAETRFLRLGPALWRARMRSGVTHQIRAHAAFVGLPILGDRLYGGAALDSPPPGAGRHIFCLHHQHLQAPGWSSPSISRPGWWPTGSEE